MKLFPTLLLGSAALTILTPGGGANFRLIEPASWLQESQLGDPQKMAPCGSISADVGKPNISCSKCTLQIVEFMAAHGLNKDGDYTDHYCAVPQITANPSKPIDTRFPAEKK